MRYVTLIYWKSRISVCVSSWKVVTEKMLRFNENPKNTSDNFQKSKNWKSQMKFWIWKSAKKIILKSYQKTPIDFFTNNSSKKTLKKLKHFKYIYNIYNIYITIFFNWWWFSGAKYYYIYEIWYQNISKFNLRLYHLSENYLCMILYDDFCDQVICNDSRNERNYNIPQHLTYN